MSRGAGLSNRSRGKRLGFSVFHHIRSPVYPSKMKVERNKPVITKRFIRKTDSSLNRKKRGES